MAARDEAVGDSAPKEHPDNGTEGDEDEQDAGERLADPVAVAEEQLRKGLQTLEEEVAETRSHDEGHVRPHPEDVAHRLP